MKSKTIGILLFVQILIIYSSLNAQVFQSKKTLYTNANAFSGWYTGNEYSAVDSYNGNVYFVMLDSKSRPFIGKIINGVTTLEALDKTYPDYIPTDDGHHEFSIGIDRDGYIHVTGDMHNFPNAEISSTMPTAYKSANMLYWKSNKPEDITDFNFTGLTPAQTVPGSDWSYGHFVTDRNHKLYYITRTLARKYYYQNGGRGLGLYSYDEATKKWTAYGTKAPISDASYPVIAWEESGQDGGSYQQYKADICFDKNNRMYLTSGMNTQNGPAQVNSVIFAYSDDGGQTFNKINGTQITLPMQVAAGNRQADVVDSEPLETFEQPSITYAFNNQPIIQYTASNSHYYKYWTGTAWSSRMTSPCQAMRGRILFNDYESKLYFVNIASGTIYSKSSFTGTTTSYSAAETFRCFDIKFFRDKNILNGISWKASTGNFQMIQLYGDTSLVPDETTTEITALSLIDATTGIAINNYEDLSKITTIDKTDLTTTQYNIYAIVTGTTDSLVFTYDLNGTSGRRKESNAPYALRGDGSGYVAWDMPVGSYEVTAMAYDEGSIQATQTINFTVTETTTWLKEQEIENDFIIYPNPARNQILVFSNESLVNSKFSQFQKISITNTLGQVVFTNDYRLTTSDFIIEVSQFPSGIYFIHLGNNTKKIIKQ